MANVPPTFKHVVVKADPSSDNWKSLRHVYEQVAKVINGKLSLGQTSGQAFETTVPSDNMDAVSILTHLTTAANTDFILNHNLNRIPSGWLVVGKNIPCDIYNGVTSWTTTQISLRSSVAFAGDGIKFLVW
jgi:hypothetical protein